MDPLPVGVCAFCLEPLSKPAILKACGHTFDAHCLKTYFDKTIGRYPGPNCPICRVKSYSSHDWVVNYELCTCYEMISKFKEIVKTRGLP